jgi:hypothetical protein
MLRCNAVDHALHVVEARVGASGFPIRSRTYCG